MADFAVTGGDDFHRLSKALKAADRTEMRKSLTKGLQAGAKPLIPLTRAAALADLPKRGGLNVVVARAPQRVQVRTGAQTAGVRLVVGSRGKGARGTNTGLIRHPVFGNRQIWVNQAVPSGWFDRTCREHAPGLVLPALEQAMNAVVNEIVKGAR